MTLKHTLPITFLALAITACAGVPDTTGDAPPAPYKRAMYVVDEADVTREEIPPHGAIGKSIAYRISDGAEDRTFEFRKRALLPGSAVGLHPIPFDEIYYVLSGEGIVTSDSEEAVLTAGMAAYLYQGSEVGIRQVGEEPLVIIITYPLPGHPRLERD